jgi:protein FAM32A
MPGTLKFKGEGAVSKKKKPKKVSKATNIDSSQLEKALDKASSQDESSVGVKSSTEPPKEDISTHIATPKVQPSSSKTATEIRFEEQRRKRMEENLKKEGAKTHKEKVEDLNRYLSKLSEHHDM